MQSSLPPSSSSVRGIEALYVSIKDIGISGAIREKRKSFLEKAEGLEYKRKRDDITEWHKYLPSNPFLCAIARARIQAPRGCKPCSKGLIRESHTVTKVPGIIAYTRCMRFVKRFFPQMRYSEAEGVR